MDVHSAPVVGKRMWSYLRAVFFMMRKSKRKLLLGMHLLMKRRNKAVARTVANLLSHHHGHHHGHALRRRREYEFSCSDSPDTGSFSMRRPLAYFPCLGAEAQLEEPLHADPATAPLRRIEYYAAASPAPSSPGALMMDEELAPGEEMECTPGRMSPLVPNAADGGGFSVRVSNFSAEEVDGDQLGGEAVDDEAEEFIARFYDQLRRQNMVGLLPYHVQEQECAA
ncbi:hypothetical protein QYE76_057612 [Lolium multiflorum]|uniref:Avr9/Cf-9 rapidly elicited protein 146 n=1 Tax=Lolium multiflorum TaxID=4521 RepID=A0AAD8T5I5_LOLMU|nr:hypothetical protein QYE76_057612 [Lolium multiflorum]